MSSGGEMICCRVGGESAGLERDLKENGAWWRSADSL